MNANREAYYIRCLLEERAGGRWEKRGLMGSQVKEAVLRGMEMWSGVTCYQKKKEKESVADAEIYYQCFRSYVVLNLVSFFSQED